MSVLPGLPDVEITFRRSARARRFSLRVSQLDGRVTLTLPPRTREAEALAFLRDQESWLRRTLERMPSGNTVEIGASVLVEGKALTLQPGTGRSIRIAADSLLVPGHPDQAARRVLAYLKVRARDRLAAASDHYAGLIGRPYTSLALRDTRSRWGSCTTDGRLMYSWRLIMAPPQVLDYVAAHEVAHLAEMNHSDAFWDVVQTLYPRYQTPRRWLKSQGQALHSYHFQA